MRSEGAVAQAKLLEFDALGWRLHRNNSGVLLDKRGVPVRFGLGNTSKQVNETTKSSDFIGWRPLLVTPEMAGDVIAQFCSVEFKHEGWTPAPPTDRARYAHEQAQLKWLEMVRADGGWAEFVSS